MYPGDGQHAWRVACVDSKPMHLSKDRGNKEEHKSFEQEYKALGPHEKLVGATDERATIEIAERHDALAPL